MKNELRFIVTVMAVLSVTSLLTAAGIINRSDAVMYVETPDTELYGKDPIRVGTYDSTKIATSSVKFTLGDKTFEIKDLADTDLITAEHDNGKLVIRRTHHSTGQPISFVEPTESTNLYHALTKAIAFKDVAAAKKVLDDQKWLTYDINVPDITKIRFLEYALMQRDEPMAKLLIERGASPQFVVITETMKSTLSPSMVKLLAEKDKRFVSLMEKEKVMSN